MFFWWICGGESVLPVLLLRHLSSSPCFVFLILHFWESHLYSRFLIFLFGICYQYCTFKNLIFSTHFYLGVRLLAGLFSPPLDSPFFPQGHLYLLPPPSFLYLTLNLSGCSGLWRTVKELIIGWITLSPFDSSLFSSCHLYLPPPYSLLYVTLWTRLSVPDCGEHIGNWLLARLLTPLLFPPLLLVTSISLLSLLFSM